MCGLEACVSLSAQAAAQAAGEAADAGAAEAAGLADDADLPLEALLARYGMVVQPPPSAPALSPPTFMR